MHQPVNAFLCKQTTRKAVQTPKWEIVPVKLHPLGELVIRKKFNVIDQSDQDLTEVTPQGHEPCEQELELRAMLERGQRSGQARVAANVQFLEIRTRTPVKLGLAF